MEIGTPEALIICAVILSAVWIFVSYPVLLLPAVGASYYWRENLTDIISRFELRK